MDKNINQPSDEIWKDIQGYEGQYQVSTLGNVRSFFRGGRVKGQFINNRYLCVTLGACDIRRVHRLVAGAFIANPESKPFVNHISGIKTDNSVGNLEWCTHIENMKHGVRMGLFPSRRGYKNPNTRLDTVAAKKVRGLYATGRYSQRKLAKNLGVSQGTIGRVVRNEKAYQ